MSRATSYGFSSTGLAGTRARRGIYEIDREWGEEIKETRRDGVNIEAKKEEYTRPDQA